MIPAVELIEARGAQGIRCHIAVPYPHLAVSIAKPTKRGHVRPGRERGIRCDDGAMNRPTRPVVVAGARWVLRDIVAEVRPRRVLLVGSSRALNSSGVLDMVQGCDVECFSGFTPNPSLEQALAGSAVRLLVRPDLIIGVGGGSAIDTAKLVRSLPDDRDSALRLLSGDRALPRGRYPRLVAIPTTAGSGSEATQFATVYVDSSKMSLDDPSVAPEYALVDPELLRTCPPPLAYSCAFDTFCHSVESCWSKRSTPRSRALAATALRLVTEALTRDLGAMSDENRLQLARAATLGGKAINLTRTTAAHAFSYSLTARFGVPHGVACLLNLLWLIDHNVEKCAPDVDLTPLRAAVRTLAPALGASRETARPSDVIRAMLARGGFSERLRDYGVGSADVPTIVDAGLASNRAANNPIAIDRDFAIERLVALV